MTIKEQHQRQQQDGASNHGEVARSCHHVIPPDSDIGSDGTPTEGGGKRAKTNEGYLSVQKDGSVPMRHDPVSAQITEQRNENAFSIELFKGLSMDALNLGCTRLKDEATCLIHNTNRYDRIKKEITKAQNNYRHSVMDNSMLHTTVPVNASSEKELPAGDCEDSISSRIATDSTLCTASESGSSDDIKYIRQLERLEQFQSEQIQFQADRVQNLANCLKMYEKARRLVLSELKCLFRNNDC
jgi:hypothetical protein